MLSLIFKRRMLKKGAQAKYFFHNLSMKDFMLYDRYMYVYMYLHTYAFQWYSFLLFSGYLLIDQYLRALPISESLLKDDLDMLTSFEHIILRGFLKSKIFTSLKISERAYRKGLENIQCQTFIYPCKS